MQVYDQLRNGQKVQFKSAIKTGTGFEASNLHKKILETAVPYELGDNDWYYLCNVDWEHRLFIEWRIPEAEMLQLGALSVRDPTTNRYTSVSLKALRLYIPGSYGREVKLQMKLFGKKPRSDVSQRTAKYCMIHRLPDDVRERE